MMRILPAEDEKALSRAVVKILEKNNYAADAVYDGEDTYSVNNQSDLLDTMDDATDTLSLLLAGIAAISLIVGIVFGSYPAAKASKLQPIEALRAE